MLNEALPYGYHRTSPENLDKIGPVDSEITILGEKLDY